MPPNPTKRLKTNKEEKNNNNNNNNKDEVEINDDKKEQEHDDINYVTVPNIKGELFKVPAIHLLLHLHLMTITRIGKTPADFKELTVVAEESKGTTDTKPGTEQLACYQIDINSLTDIVRFKALNVSTSKLVDFQFRFPKLNNATVRIKGVRNSGISILIDTPDLAVKPNLSYDKPSTKGGKPALPEQISHQIKYNNDKLKILVENAETPEHAVFRHVLKLLKNKDVSAFGAFQSGVFAGYLATLITIIAGGEGSRCSSMIPLSMMAASLVKHRVAIDKMFGQEANWPGVGHSQVGLQDVNAYLNTYEGGNVVPKCADIPKFTRKLSKEGETMLTRMLKLVQRYFSMIFDVDAVKKYSKFKEGVKDEWVAANKGDPKINYNVSSGQEALETCIAILNRKVIRHMFIHDPAVKL